MFNRGTVHIYSVGAESLIDIRPTVECRIAVLEDAQDHRYLQLMRRIYAHRPEYADECAESGGRCYLAAALGGRLIGFAWLTDERLTLDHLGWHEKLHPGTELIHSCGVHPEFRGHRVFPALLSVIARERLTAGATRIWVEVDRINLNSKRGIERVGFKPIRAIRWYRVLGTGWATERAL